ncbi:expressed unknown protein [Seminavis robusta]|uniref:Uncharacterized protein n=1 Tax=Seminavis robusta TaxID=568900 RepID=A0A9N8HP58_9STRA|nr:expressed unknown protein [Seminavis robusta]|eukprot:Sro1039_g234410.1 n/a (389) ;mRNA; f:23940-25219
MLCISTSIAFVGKASLSRGSLSRSSCRLFSSSSSIIGVDSSISRLSTLQTMLAKYGAPGSTGCTKENDLEPILPSQDAPELLASMTDAEDDELSNLHPYLYPIAKSKSSGNLICALRNAYATEGDLDNPWPIVESTIGGPGMQLLSLNSEHLMRRIACEKDFAGDDKEAVDMYNDGLGQGLMKDKVFDSPYVVGDVEKLGYGAEKYSLLRVGPFPDLYRTMSLQHSERDDEASSLIAAEAANGKFSQFGSTYRFYARLLDSFHQREEEARDASRMCLRLPLPTIGLTREDFKEVAVLGLIADKGDSEEEAMVKLQVMYEKIREHEKEDDPQANQGMTPEQMAADEANYLLDTTALTGGPWRDTRAKLAEIFRSVGKEDMAAFVNPYKP